MTAYKKELAIHDYIVLTNSYNDSILNIFGTSGLDDSSPYGSLVKHKSVCKGYATAFKLLCNMCDIECELIAEYEGKDIHHLYNRVNLEDSWYYVDVTWDDDDSSGTTKDTVDRKYFNLTKAQMQDNHDLDDDCPETASDKYTYAANNIIKVNSLDDYVKAVDEHIKNHETSPMYFDFSGCKDVKLYIDQGASGFDYYFGNDEGFEDIQNAYTDAYIDFSKLKVDSNIILRAEIFQL